MWYGKRCMEALAENKRAGFDFEILETFEAGISLLGSEVKSIAAKRAVIVGSHVVVRGGEAFLVGAEIPPYQPKNVPDGYDSSRTRKLLLNKRELAELSGATAGKGLTLIPIKMYNKSRKVKLLIGLARSKKKTDKRETIKKRETERELRRFRK
jgi:SsrA-binding protein